MLGDSYSDEWLPPGFSDPFEGFSELLRATARIDLGPDGLFVWPDPRAGFLVGWHSRNNLSQKGVEAWQILGQQAKRASSLMRAERVSFASLLAGGGDVLHQLPFFVAGAGPEQEAALDRIFDVVRQVAREIADAQPGVSTPVLVTYPDYAHSPLIRFMLRGSKDPEVAADHLAANIASFDRRVRDLAAREGYPLVDLWGLVEGIKREGLLVHGIALERDPYFVPKAIEPLQRTILTEVRALSEKAGGRISEPPRSRTLESAALSQLRGIFTVDGIHLAPILFRAWASIQCGEFRTADCSLDRVLRLALQHGPPETVGWTHVVRSFAAGARGEPSIAVEEGCEASRLGETVGSLQLRVLADRALGLALVQDGRFDEGTGVLSRLLATTRERRIAREQESWDLAYLALAELALHERERALSLAAESVGVAARMGARADEALAQLVLAHVLRAAGGQSRDAEIEAALAAAGARIAECGAHRWLPALHEETAELQALRGDATAAETAHAEALAACARLGAHPRARRLSA